MKSVDDFIRRYDGEQREWLTTMVGYMRKEHPHIQETISYQIPTYKFDGQYIAFSVAKITSHSIRWTSR